MPNLRYALITPAKNEAAFLERTILSVIAQTWRPLRWVIVDDGSTDGTAQLVAMFAERYDFIRLVSRCNTGAGRTFASKVYAFNAGLAELEGLPYDLIGNLDADMTLPCDYYANTIAAFEGDCEVGLAGGAVFYPSRTGYETNDMTPDSVGGAVQLFRRECFEQIGGYTPLECGGVDAAAEIVARMYGWRVLKLPHNPAFEERRTGGAHPGFFRRLYREGVQFHRLGYSMGFYLLRCIYRLNQTPVCLGSLASFLGYLASALKRSPACLTPEAVRYLRNEQNRKLHTRLAFNRQSPSMLCPHQRMSRTEE